MPELTVDKMFALFERKVIVDWNMGKATHKTLTRKEAEKNMTPKPIKKGARRNG